MALEKHQFLCFKPRVFRCSASDDAATAYSRSLVFPGLPTHSALVCTLGTPASPLSNCTTAQPGDSCIGGVFAASQAQFYACGDCAYYQNLTAVFSNISCCASGNHCQAIAPPPPPMDCTSLLSESSCTTRAQCFWCGNASIGFDLCQSVNSTVGYPCWAMPLLVPATACGTIGCAPSVPAYTVNNLTLASLTTYGFPLCSRCGG